MRADYPVVLDACVLAPFSLCDLLLRLAEHPRLYSPRWSSQILAEVRNTQETKLKWPPDMAESWHAAVTSAFPEAMVSGYDSLISVCANHEKDRHVLAAAIKCSAQLIVTANTKHFKESSLGEWHVEASHPQDFLCTHYDMEPGIVVAKLDDIATRRTRTREAVLDSLSKSVPAFSDYVYSKLDF